MSLRPGSGGGEGGGGGVPPERTLAGLDLSADRSVADVRSALYLGRSVAPDASDLVVLARNTALASTTLPNTGAAGGSITMSAGGVISAAGLPGVSDTALLIHSSANAHIGLAAQIAAATVQSATISAWLRLDAAVEYDPSEVFNLKHTSGASWSTPWVTIALKLSGSTPVAGGTITTGSVSALNTAATTATAARLRPQVWHHHALTYDHTTGVWRLYLDGQQVGTGTTTASALARAGDGGTVQIGGALYGGSQQRAYGHICDARIANIVRSAAWCREVYRRGVGVWEGS